MTHSRGRPFARIESHVERHMTKEVISVDAASTLRDVERVLRERGVSSALVRDGDRPVGVVSRTDLLRAARRQAAGHEEKLAPLPAQSVGELCARAPITVGAEAIVSEAAARMVEERVHRVFVEREGRIIGVLSTRDVLDAIVSARVPTPIEDVMSHPLYTIPADATVAHATDRLAQAHVSGLTVLDQDGWPIGFIGQTEALLARDRPGTTSVEDAMNPALVCLHSRAELHRAAKLARAASARRVLVVEDRRAAGVLTPLDFARAVSGGSAQRGTP
ncbi:MAG: CBS domain-containing protein [Polyangiaceae bacterium]